MCNAPLEYSAGVDERKMRDKDLEIRCIRGRHVRAVSQITINFRARLPI
jgi:hypothetical protein